MIRRLALLSLVALALGCASAKPKLVAGSTTALRLLRDWRGTWSGQIKDSPMGPMPQTLWVEEAGPDLRVTMAPIKEPGELLDTVQQAYKFLEFRDGFPHIHYVVSQKNSTQEGDMSYREELSRDDEAVFCGDEGGCDKLTVIFVALSSRELEMRTIVDEAAHSVAILRHVSDSVDRGEEQEAPAKKAAPRVESDEAADSSGRVKEHVDKDLVLDQKPDQGLRLKEKPDQGVKLKENVDRDMRLQENEDQAVGEHADKDMRLKEHVDEPANEQSDEPAPKKKKKK